MLLHRLVVAAACAAPLAMTAGCTPVLGQDYTRSENRTYGERNPVTAPECAGHRARLTGKMAGEALRLRATVPTRPGPMSIEAIDAEGLRLTSIMRTGAPPMDADTQRRLQRVNQEMVCRDPTTRHLVLGGATYVFNYRDKTGGVTTLPVDECRT